MKKVYEYVTLDRYYADELEAILKCENVAYNRDKYGSIVYAIDDKMPNFKKLKQISDDREEKMNGCRAGYYEYSDEELYNAKWMTMFNINEHYQPLPKNRDKLYNEVYEKLAGCQNCNSVYRQKAPFRFSKPFNFRGYHATRTMGVASIFFVDGYFKECCSKEDIKGFSVDPVYAADYKTELDNTYQFHILNKLNFEADIKTYEEKLVCNSCGKHMYIPYSNNKPSFVYYKESDLNECDLDVYYSLELSGVSIAFTRPMIIISNKMYRVLKDNHLDKDFKFDVIQLL